MIKNKFKKKKQKRRRRRRKKKSSKERSLDQIKMQCIKTFEVGYLTS